MLPRTGSLWLTAVCTMMFICSSASLPSGQAEDDALNITASEIKYLKKYNYIPERSNHVADIMISGYDLTRAVAMMQTFFGLDITGTMDDETRNMMKKPRCGVKDIITKNLANYNLHGSKWNKKHLTWRVVTNTSKVSYSDVNQAIEYSLNVWADVSGLSFEHKLQGPVDMEIGFYTKSHLGEDSINDFDGEDGTLAHAYFPTPGVTFAGDTHMDDDEDWAVKRKYYETNKKSLIVVFVHEFGHALGLKHEPDVTDSIMRPIYGGWAETVTLSQDDISGIQVLYGTNDGHEVPSTTTTTVKADNFCSVGGIDAAMENSRTSYLLFKDDELRYVPIWGNIMTYKVNDVFVGSLRADRKIDASLRTYVVYNWKYMNGMWKYVSSSSNMIYLFQGSKVHSFIPKQGYYLEVRVDDISSKFSGVPDDIDSAFVWSGNDMIYITKGPLYYRIEETTATNFRLVTGYPLALSIWKGLPDRVDAALYMRRNEITVFFRQNNYYKFDDYQFKVSKYYPRNVDSDWLGCYTAGYMTGSETEPQLSIDRITDNAAVVPVVAQPAEKKDGSKPDGMVISRSRLTERPPSHHTTAMYPHASDASLATCSVVAVVLLSVFSAVY